jgi:hypothetical protein
MIFLFIKVKKLIVLKRTKPLSNKQKSNFAQIKRKWISKINWTCAFGGSKGIAHAGAIKF